MIASLVAAVALSAMPTAAAHEGNNHGTIKVHDDETVDPAVRNDPHVSCEFWIEGFNMADDSGRLEFSSIPPTSNPPVLVLTDTWNGTPEGDGDGFHFNNGPYTLEPGHYKVEAFLDEGRPGDEEHKAKSKVFWVNPCPDGGEEPPEVPCPPGLNATANADGSITLSWDAVANASEYRIYRASGDDDVQFFASTTNTTFTDTETEIGVTYRYMVTAVVDGAESKNCEEVEATAIPFFPSAMVAVLGTVGAVAAMMVARRK